MANLLITGGAGFIGSHTALVLLEARHHLVVLDSYANSSPEALRRVAELAGLEAAARLQVIEGDIRSQHDLERAFSACAALNGKPADAVIHFAGLKAVGESVAEPLRYWDVNLSGSRQLVSAMQTHGCRTLVFSSTSTVYGEPEDFPIRESWPTKPLHPYAQTKLAVEWMLQALEESEPGWRIARLRYFNPVGAHPSGRIGEDPNGPPNNLFPFVSQVAVGRRPQLQVFGGDWPTADGTGVRDYIHVMDLAEGHRAAVEHLLASEPQLLTLNLGSGTGHSVLEVVQAFAAASGRTVPYAVVDRRPGDAAITVADPSRAAQVLGWRTQRGLAQICADGWAWQSSNPQGYGA